MALKKLLPFPFTLLLSTLILISFFSLASAQEEEPLSKAWKKWINEYVVHIISERERGLFFKLNTEEQRQAFQRDFWLERDPTPGTSRNEYMEEHDERFKYAVRYLGRDSSRAGWQTDRGRYYIILGKPRQIQRMPSAGEVYPLEIWFYQADKSKGLPSFFNLIFWKKFGAGEYRLYSPVVDGPPALFTTQTNLSNTKAYENLFMLNPDLAQAAFSFTFDQTVSRGTIAPSLSSVTLIGKIENQKNIGADASYAERILLGTSSVTTNYTFSNFIFPNVIFPQLKKNGLPVINYSFQVPTRMMNMGKYDDKIYGALEIETTVANEDGIQLLSKSDHIDLEYTPEEFEKLKYAPLVYEDQVLSLSGYNSVSIRIRNPLTKEYFLIADKVLVPKPGVLIPQVGKLLVCSGTEKVKSGYSAPFQFSSFKLSVNPDRSFSPGQTLFLYSQIIVPESFKVASRIFNVSLSLLSEKGKEITSITQPFSSAKADEHGLIHLTIQFPMKLGPGGYIQALEVDFGGEYEKQLRTFSFKVADNRPALNRHYGTILNLTAPPVIKEMGRMNELAGNLENAKNYLLQAISEDKSDLDTRIALGKVLFKLNNYQEIKNLLQHSLTESPDNVQILHLLGCADYKLGQYSKATKYLERYLVRKQNDVEVLNMLADSWSKLENDEKALKYWHRSLEIDTDQSDIRMRLQGLK